MARKYLALTRNEVLTGLVVGAAVMALCLIVVAAVVLIRTQRESLPAGAADKAEVINNPPGYPDLVAMCIHGAGVIVTRPTSGGFGKASPSVASVPLWDTTWCRTVDDSASVAPHS